MYLIWNHVNVGREHSDKNHIHSKEVFVLSYFTLLKTANWEHKDNSALLITGLCCSSCSFCAVVKDSNGPHNISISFQKCDEKLLLVNGKLNGDTWWWMCAFTVHSHFRSPNTGTPALCWWKSCERALPRLHVSGLHQVHKWGGKITHTGFFFLQRPSRHVVLVSTVIYEQNNYLVLSTNILLFVCFLICLVFGSVFQYSGSCYTQIKKPHAFMKTDVCCFYSGL